MRKLIRCGKLFTGSETDALSEHTLVIEDDKVAFAGPTAKAPEAGPHDEVIDHSRHFVMPGLIDSHVHLSYGNAKTQEDIDLYASVEFRAIRGLEAAQRVLRAGYTAMADLSISGRVSLAVRDAIEAGLFAGPRVSSSGRALTTRQGLDDWYPRWIGVPETSIGVLVRNVAEGIEEVRGQVKDGVNFVKLAMDGDAMNPATGMIAGFNQEETSALITEIHRLGKKAVCHARGAEAVRYSARAGADVILHASWMDDEGLDLVVKNRCALIPTLSLIVNNIDFTQPTDACYAARVFTCMYHGWSFRPNGELSGVPMRRDFQEATLKDPQSGMARLPRMGNYRGFVFASFSPDVLPLLEYLGEARRGIDELVDRSPEGEIEFWAGCHRYEYNGNWKLQFENMADMYHPPACHASTVGPDGRQFSRRPGNRGGSAPFFAANGEPIVAQTGVRGFSNGHSSEASLFREEQAGGIWDDYRALMVKRYGEERTADILKNRRHSMALFPSVDILIAQTSVRVIRPISVDKTEVQVYPVRLKGAPPEISIDIVRFVNITHAAASLIQSDDLEAFERGQQGLTAGGTDWVLVARGFGQEIDEGNGVLFGDRSSEVGQRAQHYAWRDLMSAA